MKCVELLYAFHFLTLLHPKNPKKLVINQLKWNGRHLLDNFKKSLHVW